MFIAIGSTMTARRRWAMCRDEVLQHNPNRHIALHWSAKPITTSGYKHIAPLEQRTQTG